MLTPDYNSPETVKLSPLALWGGCAGMIAFAGVWVAVRAVLDAAGPASAAAAVVSADPVVASPDAAPIDGSSATSAEPAFETLSELMQVGLSQPFGELSVLTWRMGELTEERLADLTTPATAMAAAAQQLPTLAKRNFSQDEQTFFDRLAAALIADSAALAQASTGRDPAAADRLLTRIDTTCQSCHARLAPRLVRGTP